MEKSKKCLQHSGALGADKAADGHVDVSGAPLVAVEAHLVLGTRCLDIPKIKRLSILKPYPGYILKGKTSQFSLPVKQEVSRCQKIKIFWTRKKYGPARIFQFKCQKVHVDL